MGAEGPRGGEEGGQEGPVSVDDSVVQETGVCSGEKRVMLQYGIQ